MRQAQAVHMKPCSLVQYRTLGADQSLLAEVKREAIVLRLIPYRRTQANCLISLCLSLVLANMTKARSDTKS